MDDVILNKAASIERCLARINEEYAGSEDELETNYTKQDAIILNLQRACQLAVDMGAHLVRVKRLGVPQSSRDIFTLLTQGNLIPKSLSLKMQAMVGFRNIAVHEYSALNIEVVRSIIEDHLDDFSEYISHILKAPDDAQGK